MSRIDPSTPPPAKPGRRRLGLALLGGAVGLSLVLALAFVLIPRDTTAPDGPVAETPGGAVRGFLDSLVAGQATAALGYAREAPTDATWLTDEALAAAREVAPLAVVSVGDVPGGTAPVTVPATLRIGETNHELQVPVTRVGSNWRLDRVTADLNLANVPTTFPVTINGTLAPINTTLAVFPGAYVIASGLPEVSLPAKPLVADALGAAFDVTLAPRLTKAGQQRLIALAKTSLKTCLAERALAPEGCPNVVAPAPGQKMTEKTIRWTLVDDPWSKATFEVNTAQPTLVSGSGRFTFRLRGSLKQGSLTYDVDQLLPYTVHFQADLTSPATPMVWTRD